MRRYRYTLVGACVLVMGVAISALLVFRYHLPWWAW